jgi:RNA polymerase sigma-70 factor (ECF subfamily)
MEPLASGKLLQTGDLGVSLTPRPIPTSISVRLLQECDGRLVATPLNFHLSFADGGVVNPAASRDSSDEELVRAAQSGDRNAFGHLYERFAGMVHGILLARVPRAAVEDLVQDVFVRAMPRVGSLREVSRFGGWLAAIARNRAVDFFRESHPGTEQLDDAPDAEPASRNGSSADRAEAHAVLAAIRTLPEAYREPLILRLVEGMTGPEIAARTGLTHGSVRVNLHRGMQQLRQVLDLGGEKSAERL